MSVCVRFQAKQQAAREWDIVADTKPRSLVLGETVTVFSREWEAAWRVWDAAFQACLDCGCPDCMPKPREYDLTVEWPDAVAD